MDKNMDNTLARERASFFQSYSTLRLDKKQTVIPGGEEPGGIFYLHEGYVREYDISAKSGNELTFHIYGPGSFFPLTWGLAGIPNRHFFQSMTDCELRVAPKEDVVQFLAQHPEQLLELTQRLLKGLSGLMTRMEFQVFADAYTQISAELVYLGRHFGHQEGNQVVLQKHFTHQTLADLTGMVRETISVAIEKLVKQGVISYQGNKIVIHNIEQLSKELERLA